MRRVAVQRAYALASARIPDLNGEVGLRSACDQVIGHWSYALWCCCCFGGGVRAGRHWYGFRIANLFFQLKIIFSVFQLPMYISQN